MKTEKELRNTSCNFICSLEISFSLQSTQTCSTTFGQHSQEVFFQERQYIPQFRGNIWCHNQRILWKLFYIKKIPLKFSILKKKNIRWVKYGWKAPDKRMLIRYKVGPGSVIEPSKLCFYRAELLDHQKHRVRLSSTKNAGENPPWASYVGGEGLTRSTSCHFLYKKEIPRLANCF